MLTSQSILSAINNRLESLELPLVPNDLYAPIKYVLSVGGKRIRPLLMLATYNMYKDSVSEILNQAVAIEMYHNYTLLHDDLMDKADMRRGKLTVHKKWNENVALLSGDAMLVLAYQLMSDTTSTFKDDVLKLFSRTALEICEGQQYDMDFEKKQVVSESEYIEMIRLKTSVLLACSLKIGAILAGSPVPDAEMLYKFGENLGLAFQLQDDYLDVYGDKSIFGKNIGGDIICNKKTYLLIRALELSDESQHKELSAWINAENFIPEDKIKAVTSIYNSVGIREVTEKRIIHYTQLASSCLEHLSVSEEKKGVLYDILSQLSIRNH